VERGMIGTPRDIDVRIVPPKVPRKHAAMVCACAGVCYACVYAMPGA
jgi:hypothetical protein